MFEFNKPKIQIAEMSEDGKYAKFIMEPLERGYGTTLGNALRRIMLSALPGTAVSGVKINGVMPGKGIIPGVKEDVREIILNLKSLAIRDNRQSDEATNAYMIVKKEGIVKAGDIFADPGIEVLNIDQTIATLSGTTGSNLYMELMITKGRGYVRPDKEQTENLPGDVFPIEAVYTPVERVDMTVENTRVGQVTDYDRLTLDVRTNGVLDATEAVGMAAMELNEHLKPFIDLSSVAESAAILTEKEDKDENMKLEMGIEELELSLRSYNCLKRAGIHTVQELCSKTRGDMMKIRNMGQKSMEEVLGKMNALGLHLRAGDDF